jgi:hypothetical protein
MGDIENELSSDTSGHNMMLVNLTTWGDHLYANPRQVQPLRHVVISQWPNDLVHIPYPGTPVNIMWKTCQ